MELLNKFLNIFLPKKEVKQEQEVKEEYVDFKDNSLDFNYCNSSLNTTFVYFNNDKLECSLEEFLNKYDPNKKTIFFLDNYEDIKYVIKACIEKMSDGESEVSKNDFNFIGIFGVSSVKLLYKMHLLDKVKIDYAVLDLTLEELVKCNNKPVMLDGIDVAINILDKNKDCDVSFLTSHTLSTKVPTLRKFYKKYEYFIGKIKNNILSDVYVNKNKVLRENLLSKLFLNKG